MALEISKQTVEFESCAGSGSAQALARAETLVPGAGREAIEVLISDALVNVDRVEAQTDRIVVEGSVRCQAAYRQGDGSTLRAVAAQSQLSQVFEMPGVMPGMTARACAAVESAEAKYENGHMVFLVSISINAQAFRLTGQEIITGAGGMDGIQTLPAELCSTRITAETEASSAIREEITLPAALDARTALMEWGSAWVESCEADLGGVRVKGRIGLEALISSGVEGRPVASVRHPIEFDQLVEVPEWLAGDVCAEASVTKLDSRVEQGGEKEDSILAVEAEVSVHVTSIGRDKITALTDAYSTSGRRLDTEITEVAYCADTSCHRISEQVRGTLLLSENAPGVGNVISVSVHPNISGWATNGESTIEGVIEATVLYMPGGSDIPASARSEMPFAVKYPGTLNDGSMVLISVLSAEASTLMSDRVELKCTLGIQTFTRTPAETELLTGLDEGGDIKKRPGIIICWPAQDDSPWTIGKRYSVPEQEINGLTGGSPVPSKPIVIRI